MGCIPPDVASLESPEVVDGRPEHDYETDHHECRESDRRQRRQIISRCGLAERRAYPAGRRAGCRQDNAGTALAKSVNGSFKRIQCTPDLLPTDVTGVSVFNQKSTEFEFRPGPIFAQLVLADEVNRATPRTQAAAGGDGRTAGHR